MLIPILKRSVKAVHLYTSLGAESWYVLPWLKTLSVMLQKSLTYLSDLEFFFLNQSGIRVPARFGSVG